MKKRELKARVAELETELERLGRPFCMDTGEPATDCGECPRDGGDACLVMPKGAAEEIVTSRRHLMRLMDERDAARAAAAWLPEVCDRNCRLAAALEECVRVMRESEDTGTSSWTAALQLADAALAAAPAPDPEKVEPARAEAETFRCADHATWKASCIGCAEEQGEGLSDDCRRIADALALVREKLVQGLRVYDWGCVHSAVDEIDAALREQGGEGA